MICSKKKLKFIFNEIFEEPYIIEDTWFFNFTGCEFKQGLIIKSSSDFGSYMNTIQNCFIHGNLVIEGLENGIFNTHNSIRDSWIVGGSLISKNTYNLRVDNVSIDDSEFVKVYNCIELYNTHDAVLGIGEVKYENLAIYEEAETCRANQVLYFASGNSDFKCNTDIVRNLKSEIVLNPSREYVGYGVKISSNYDYNNPISIIEKVDNNNLEIL